MNEINIEQAKLFRDLLREYILFIRMVCNSLENDDLNTNKKRKELVKFLTEEKLDGLFRQFVIIETNIKDLSFLDFQPTKH